MFSLKIAEALVFGYILFIFFAHPDGKVGHEPYIGMVFFLNHCSSKFTNSPLCWAS